MLRTVGRGAAKPAPGRTLGGRTLLAQSGFRQSVRGPVLRAHSQSRWQGTCWGAGGCESLGQPDALRGRGGEARPARRGLSIADLAPAL